MNGGNDNTARFSKNYPSSIFSNSHRKSNAWTEEAPVVRTDDNQTIKSALKLNVKNFMTTTSVKGISKAIKSESRVLRIVWITSTCTGLAISIILISLILVSYFHYDVVTNIDECSTCIPEFPDITVCPLNILSILADFPMTSYEEYIDQLHTVEADYNIAAYPERDYNSFKELLSVNAYYENFNQTGFLATYEALGGRNVFVHDCSW